MTHWLGHGVQNTFTKNYAAYSVYFPCHLQAISEFKIAADYCDLTHFRLYYSITPPLQSRKLWGSSPFVDHNLTKILLKTFRYSTIFLMFYLLAVQKSEFGKFLFKFFLLKKALFIWKQKCSDILLQFKLTVLYLNIFKAEFSASLLQWSFRNHSNMLICCSRNISDYYHNWKLL